MNNTNTSIKNCFTLLKLIHQNGVMKAGDLADILKVSDKQVRRYVHALNAAGIEIISKRGKSGGFYIEENKCPLCEKYFSE